MVGNRRESQTLHTIIQSSLKEEVAVAMVMMMMIMIKGLVTQR
jgi:hypothetical protein